MNNGNESWEGILGREGRVVVEGQGRVGMLKVLHKIKGRWRTLRLGLLINCQRNLRTGKMAEAKKAGGIYRRR